jgi:hypothetical protein
MIHACDQGSVTPLRRNDVRRRSSSTPLKVGTEAEPLDSRQGAMQDDCPRVVMHMHESTSTLINSHACMHGRTHAARTHAKAAPTTESWTSVASNHWHTLLGYSSRPGRSTRQRRKWQDTLVCVKSKVSQRCHMCDGSGPSLPSTACKHSHPQAQPDTYHRRAKNAWHLAGERARCAATQGSVEGRAHVDARGSGCVKTLTSGCGQELAIHSPLCS